MTHGSAVSASVCGVRRVARFTPDYAGAVVVVRCGGERLGRVPTSCHHLEVCVVREKKLQKNNLNCYSFFFFFYK